ncbi:transposase [Nocardia sp. NPDC004711]
MPHNCFSLFGAGAVTAAVILTVWSHPGRIKTETALAKIAGTCPIPASSGQPDPSPTKSRRRPPPQQGDQHRRSDPHTRR